MSKKQVRMSEKTLALAKQELLISADTTASPDELMIMLIMKLQKSRDEAQGVLDYAGDEFMQKVSGQNNSRLKKEKGHLVENDKSLDIERLLKEIDQKPSEVGLSSVKDELTRLRQEVARNYRRQSGFASVNALELKLILAKILSGENMGRTPASVVADLTLDSEAKAIMQGLDEYALETVKAQVKSENKKKKGHYSD